MNIVKPNPRLPMSSCAPYSLTWPCLVRFISFAAIPLRHWCDGPGVARSILWRSGLRGEARFPKCSWAVSHAGCSPVHPVTCFWSGDLDADPKPVDTFLPSSLGLDAEFNVGRAQSQSVLPKQ